MEGGISARAAARVLALLEYQSSPERLLQLYQAGMIDPPPEPLIVVQGRPVVLWSEESLLNLCEQLEALREWAPFSPLHDPKRTDEERAEIKATHVAELQQLEQLAALPLQSLLLLVRDLGDQADRCKVLSAIVAKLRIEHGIEVFPAPVAVKTK